MSLSPLDVDYVLHRIFRFLSFEQLAAVSLVSKRFAAAATHDDVVRFLLPQHLPLRRFGRSPLPLIAIAKSLHELYQPDVAPLACRASAVEVQSCAAHDAAPRLFPCRYAPGQQLAVGTVAESSHDNDQDSLFTLRPHYFWSSVGRADRHGREFIVYKLSEPFCVVTGCLMEAASLRRVYAPLSIQLTVGSTLDEVLPSEDDRSYRDDDADEADGRSAAAKKKRARHDDEPRKLAGPIRAVASRAMACAASFAFQSFQLDAPLVGGFVRVDFNGFLPDGTHFAPGLEHLHYHCISAVKITGYPVTALPLELGAAVLNNAFHPTPAWRRVGPPDAALRVGAGTLIRAHAQEVVRQLLHSVSDTIRLRGRRAKANGFSAEESAERDANQAAAIDALLAYLKTAAWLDGVLEDVGGGDLATSTDAAAEQADVDEAEALLDVRLAGADAATCTAAHQGAVRARETARQSAPEASEMSALALLADFVLERPFLEAQESTADTALVASRRTLSTSLAPVSDGEDALLAIRLLRALLDLRRQVRDKLTAPREPQQQSLGDRRRMPASIMDLLARLMGQGVQMVGGEVDDQVDDDDGLDDDDDDDDNRDDVDDDGQFDDE
jgi:hypothetical protein